MSVGKTLDSMDHEKESFHTGICLIDDIDITLTNNLHLNIHILIGSIVIQFLLIDWNGLIGRRQKVMNNVH